MEDALASYFDRPGCTNPMAINYDPRALKDDGKCELPKTIYFRLKTTDNK